MSIPLPLRLIAEMWVLIPHYLHHGEVGNAWSVLLLENVYINEGLRHHTVSSKTYFTTKHTLIV